MQYTKLIWRDGRPYSEEFDDIYYSSEESEGIPGESEFLHVFFKHNRLPERWLGRNDFVIAELGLGSTLNCVLTIREWLKHCAQQDLEKTLHYIAIEKHPLSANAIKELLGRHSQLKEICEQLIENYPPAVKATHCRSLFNGRVIIHYKFMDVSEALQNEKLNIDAWYLDGFAPAKNPDMWSQQLFNNIAANSGTDATCSTYTSAGQVKRNLVSAGFAVKKVTGFGNKREMLTAVLSESNSTGAELPAYRYKDKPWFVSPVNIKTVDKDAIVVGAGIAGLCVAYSLVRRGWKVTVIDKYGDTQKEASSNPAPIVYPRLSVDNAVDTEFYTAAYCYALHMFEVLQKKSQQKFWFSDGVLQKIEKNRISTIINKFGFNSDFVSIEKQLADSDGQITANFLNAGVVLPTILCEVLKQECGNKLDFIKAELTGVNYNADRWQCLIDNAVIKSSECIIIANGSEINNLGLPLCFPVQTVRGQVVVLNENTCSAKIKQTLNSDFHITPSINAKHYLGATYQINNNLKKISDADNQELLQLLENTYPNVFSDSDYSDAWVGFRTISKDRVPIVGAMPDIDFFSSEYADICHGNARNNYKPACHMTGLFVSAAHGSRGFTSSFLSAEIIASQITGEPSPVSKNIQSYLNPSRFIVNDLKRR